MFYVRNYVSTNEWIGFINKIETEKIILGCESKTHFLGIFVNQTKVKKAYLRQYTSVSIIKT